MLQMNMILFCLHHKLPDYKKKYGIMVMSIEIVDFTTSDFEEIIQKALHS